MPFDALPQRPDGPPRVVDLLRQAKNNIGSPNRWAKYCFFREPKSMCAVQSVQVVCQYKRATTRLLVRALAEELPRRYRILFFLPNRMKVISFNDHKHTNHAMVMGLFDRAIERLELMHG